MLLKFKVMTDMWEWNKKKKENYKLIGGVYELKQKWEHFYKKKESWNQSK
jgi:hypothetical protein